MSEFRSAQRADVPALHGLIERTYRGHSAKAGWTHEADLLGGQRIDLAALVEIIDDPDQTILIHEYAGAPIGCVCVADRGGGTAYLGLLTVDPLRQAGGLGRRLIEAAEDHARSLSCSAMEMTVIVQRADLIAWYERRGFALTGERRPFPLDDARFGLPTTRDLEFVVLAKPPRPTP